MDKNILFKSLFQGFAAMLLLALMLCIAKGGSFHEILLEPYTILTGVACFIGCYIGTLRRAKRKYKK